jgi:hypothetical protein
VRLTALVGSLTLVGICSARAEEILQCGPYYLYRDIEILIANAYQHCHRGGYAPGAQALGYTLSATPPGLEKEFIDEIATVCDAVTAPIVISRNRRIPRYRVTGTPPDWVGYLRFGGQDITCQTVEYQPPSTANRPPDEVLAKQPPVTHGELIVGTANVEVLTTRLGVNRRPMALYGVVGLGGPHVRAAAELINGRPVRCRAVDIGGFWCESNGQDLSELLARNSLARAHRTAHPRILAAEREAKSAARGVWGQSALR